jgi:hypothetical protein
MFDTPTLTLPRQGGGDSTVTLTVKGEGIILQHSAARGEEEPELESVVVSQVIRITQI